jgi:uncharacterized protein with ParB-like and HNH nuclease domain
MKWDMNNSNDIKELTIKELFSTGKYVIPRYQRNYAWQEKEITQLIQDVYDYALKDKTNYYIGTLVVYERSHNGHTYYETIDGQQRLTTLNLIISAIKRNFANHDKIYNFPFELNLAFDSRKKSTSTLQAIAEINGSKEPFFRDEINYESNIKQGYWDTVKFLKNELKEDNTIINFFRFLTENVKIFRVKVPHDTDLNHYFEIMNNRGEQLEKHEILKAKMLETLKNEDSLKYSFNLIWEACSDMDRYVQYGFSTSRGNQKKDERKIIFGVDWNNLQFSTLDEIANSIFESNETNTFDYNEDSLTIEEITKQPRNNQNLESTKSNDAERFSSVVSFPNFLLHVLRIVTKENIPLDDKRLLDTFNHYLEKGPCFVKEFGFALLKTRFLFDKYIIKREFLNDNEQWSLKQLKLEKDKPRYVNSFGEDENGQNKEIIMLLSMFHVSSPTQIYKHWLNAALYHVVFYGAQSFLYFLHDLSKAFFFDRFLAKEPLDYYDIIYQNQGIPKQNSKNVNWDILNKGVQVENFIFNYLDFELWKRKAEGYEKFEFAFRSSVEHYYPQNPVANIEKLKKEICDNFGNLCLLSSSKNSRLTNHTPEAKKDYYIKAGIDSLKQKVMMNYPEEWDEKAILKHGKEMEDILKSI